MKKILLFLLTIMLGFSSLQLSAQETLTVHDGTSTNGYVPVYGFYADAYLKAEFIMPANELSEMLGGQISSMKFYASESSVSWGTANFQVFLTEVSSTSINSFQGSSNATTVYTGALNITNNEMVVTFTTPYTYNGGNLLIGIYNTVIGSYITSTWYGETVNGASFQGYSYTDLNSVSGSQRNFLPKTTFTYTAGDVTCFAPNNPTITGITSDEATLSWTPREGQSAWEVCCLSDEEDIEEASWTPVVDTFYTFTGLDAATHYTAYVRTNCGTEISTVRSTAFITECTTLEIPYTFAFNNETMASCWTSIDVDNNGFESYGGFFGKIYINLAEACASYFYISDAAANDWLISPSFNIPSSGAIVSFDYRVYSSYYTEKYSVYVIPEGSTYTSAIQILPTQSITNDEWETKYIDISAYAGETVKIGFKVESDADMDGIYFTNFFIGEEIPSTMTATPEAINFGNVPVGETREGTFLINSANLNEDIVLTTEAPYSLSYNGSDYSTSLTIPANPTLEVTDTVHVQYAPADTGHTEAFVTISTSELFDTVTLAGFAYSCEPISTLPQTWGFEAPNIGGTNGYPIPACWNRLGHNNYPYSYSYSYYAHAGNYSLYAGPNPVNRIAILPAINTEVLDISTLQLNFFAQHYSAYGMESALIEIGIMSDPNDASTFTMIDTVGLNNGLTSSYNEFQIPLDTYTGEGAYIAFRFNAIGSDPYGYSSTGSIYIDDLSLNTIPSCARPENVSVSNISHNSAEISWTSEEASFNVYYKEENANSFTLANENPLSDTTLTLTGLSSSTRYVVYVASICADESEVASLFVNFTTECGIEVAPYTEDFAGFDNEALCWETYSGLASSIFNGDTLTSTSYGWSFSSTYVYPIGHPKVNIYGSSCNYWLVSPAIDLSQLDEPALSFNLALTDYYSDAPIDDPTDQNDDIFMVIISTDNGATWSEANATIWNNAGTGNYSFNAISTTGDDVLISLSQYADSTIRIAFYGESTETNGDNDLHIANLSVNEMPACARPTSVSLASVSNNEASITWDNVENTSWEVVYDTTGFVIDEAHAETAFENSFIMQDLEANTSYDVYVRTVCDGEGHSEWTNVFTFTTLCNAIVVTDDDAYEENFSSDADCWILNNWTVNSGNLSHTYYSEGEAILPVFDLSEVSIPYLKFSQMRNDYYDYAEVLRVYVRSSVEEEWTMLGEYSDAIPSWHTDSLPLINASANYQIKFTITGTYESSYIDNVMVYNNNDAPTCFAPVGLNANNISSNSAVVSWNTLLEGTTVELYYKESSDSIYTVVTSSEFTDDNSYLMTNLTPATNYDVYVASICDDDTLATDIMSFFTQCEAFSTFPFNESFADTSATLGCWTVVDANNDANTFVLGEDGTAYYPYHTSHAANDWLISPIFVLDGNQIADFDYMASSTYYTERFQVFAIGIDTTIALTQIISVNTTTAQNLMLDLNNLIGNYQIGIQCVSSANQYNFIVDNFRIRAANVAELNVDPTSMSFVTELGNTPVAQTAHITGMAISNDLTVNTVAPFEVSMDGINFATTTTIPAPGLMFDTLLYVRYNPTTAGSDNGTVTLTDGTISVSITVDGEAVDCSIASTLPYTENFDSYITNSTYQDNNGIAPSCWTTYSNNTTYGAPHITSTGSYHYVNSGSNSMVFTCGEAGSDAYAALPTIANPLNTLNLNFWRAMESSSSGTLTVGYVTDLNDLAGSFVVVANIPSVYYNNATADDTINVNFAAADNVPANGNICFHWSHSTSFYSCCIDDITVTVGDVPVVTDPSVTTGNASALGQTAATLNATITNPDNVTITAKGFEWKATNGGSYTQITGTGTGNDFTANLTGLTASTSYTFKAFISFNGETVYGDEVSFTTLNEDEEPCDAPSNLTVSNITAHTATMSWNEGGSETSWKVGYKLQSASQWQEATVQTTSYSLEGLTAESTYDVRVKAICTDNESDFVSSNFTTAEEVGIDNITLANSINLMPNPADNYIELRVNSNVDVTEAVVYNAFGQMVQTVVLTDNHARIDLSNMAAGMYFVRVNGDNVTATKKFIRK